MTAGMVLHIGDFQLGEPANVEFSRLMRERLLIQASSGGGKSWLIRRLVEETHGKAPIVLIDREGEFASLREQYDFVLAGRRGDTPITIATAAALARTVLELSVNIICDLSDLTLEEQQQWVAAFLTAFVGAPEELWKDFLVVLDEAHLFAPEEGKCISKKAVANLTSLGRKRGFCAVLATQRLGKLDKDIAAELQNVLIGKTVLDIDRDRAARALDVSRAHKLDFFKSIRKLSPGVFYAYGSSIVEEEPRLLKVGPVKTTHREPGARTPSVPPPPTEAIVHLLPRFKGLGSRVVEEERTTAAEHARVTALEGELEGLRVRCEKAEASVKELEGRAYLSNEMVAAARRIGVHAGEVMLEAAKIAPEVLAPGDVGPVVRLALPDPVLGLTGPSPEKQNGHRRLPPPPRRRETDDSIPLPLRGFLLCEREILTALAARGGKGATRVYLAIVTGYDLKGGGFQNALGKLKKERLVYAEGDFLALTGKGELLFEDRRPAPRTVEEVIAIWEAKKEIVGKAKLILRYLYSLKGEERSRAEIAAEVKMIPGTGGFENYMGTLNSKNLIERGRRGYRISSVLTALALLVMVAGLGGLLVSSGPAPAARPAPVQHASGHAVRKPARKLPVLAMETR